MIKGFGFGKLLKQLFIISLISCFGFGVSSFASASCYPLGHGVVGQYSESLFYDNWYSHGTYDVKLTNNGNFFTQNLNTSRDFFAPNDRIIWYRNKDGRLSISWFVNPAYYDTSFPILFQVGDVSTFLLCDYVNGDFSSFNNCTRYSYSGNESFINTYLNNISDGDRFFYGDSADFGYSIYKHSFFLAVNISNDNKLLVFQAGYCIGNGVQCGNDSCYPGINYSSSQYTLLDNNSPTSGYSYSDFPENLVGFSPITSGGGGTGTGGNGTGDSGTGDDSFDSDFVYAKCTYKAILDYAESVGYNQYLCYGGLDNFDLYNSGTVYNPIPGTGKTLGQILSSSYASAWDTPLEWFNFWDGLRGGYVDIWSSYPAVFKTWFDLYYQYGGGQFNFDVVREYCSIVNSDIDFENTIYHGLYFKNTCEFIQDRDIGIEDENGNIIGVDWNGGGTDGTGDYQTGTGNFDGGVGIGSGLDFSGGKINSPVGYIQDFFAKLKANFPTRYDMGGGFLPVYIITFLCALILFRFLRH